ncbi:MAG: complex I subunit 5 family protein [Armatimonadota bacterium]
MSEGTTSALPVLLVIVPAVVACLIPILGRTWLWSREVLALIGATGAFVFSLWAAVEVLGGAVLTAFGEQLYMDALSALLVVLVSLVGLLATIYSLRYMKHHAEGGEAEGAGERRLSAYYGWLMLFIATMLWACISNNIIMLYVAVEASTIASGLLVAHYWNRRALEAGYKYLMLLTVGITFSLFGCVLVYASGANILGGGRGLLVSELRTIAGQFPATTVALASAFLIVGFGTKAGIAPFHPWLPDAHAEAPTPVSALLSGVMLKVAIYALVRTVSIFYPEHASVATFALALGVFTLVLGDLMALAQDDVKRMLAYSSVSQMGYVLMGFGIGTQLGLYAGLFHLVNHALAKSLLFLAAGAVIYSTGVRSISQLGGLAKRMPVTSFCFFAGALSLAGVPPFNGFQSKLALLTAGALVGSWWAVILALATSLVTVLVLLRAAKSIFWGEASAQIGEAREAPAGLCATMAVLAVLCLAIGMYPQGVYKPLKAAAVVLETVSAPRHQQEVLAKQNGLIERQNFLSCKPPADRK